MSWMILVYLGLGFLVGFGFGVHKEGTRILDEDAILKCEQCDAEPSDDEELDCVLTLGRCHACATDVLIGN